MTGLLRNSDGSVLTQTVLDADTTTNDLGNNYTIGREVLEDFVLPGTNGVVSTRVKYADGDVITQAKKDANYAEPTVPGALSPNGGTTGGGTVVTITGTNLVPGQTTVTFGGTAATAVTVNAAGTSLTCVTPAKTAGAVTVVITTPAGSVTKTTAYTYS